jgi:quercetin dioxygenase-like cupin family protein
MPNTTHTYTHTHTYTRTHKLSGNALAFNLKAEEGALLDKARTAKSGRAAKTLVKQGPLRVTVVALRKGAALGRHHVEGPLSIQSLTGRLRIGVGDQNFDLPSRGLLTLEPGTTHDATALTDATFLITMAIA